MSEQRPRAARYDAIRSMLTGPGEASRTITVNVNVHLDPKTNYQDVGREIAAVLQKYIARGGRI